MVRACETALCARFTVSSRPAEPSVGTERRLSALTGRRKVFSQPLCCFALAPSDVTARGHSGPDFALSAAGAPGRCLHVRVNVSNFNISRFCERHKSISTVYLYIYFFPPTISGKCTSTLIKAIQKTIPLSMKLVNEKLRRKEKRGKRGGANLCACCVRHMCFHMC